MITQKYNNRVYVIEGFVILFLSKVIFTILAAKLHFIIPFVPDITMVLLSAVVACTLTIFYLFLRTRCTPIFNVNNKTFLYSVSGMIVILLYQIISSFLFVKNSAPMMDLIAYKDVYKYINIICFIMLGPITEEIIYRGYFVKLLMPKGTLSALLITSVLFVTSHLLLRDYSILEMLVNGIYFFLFSMTVGFVYSQAGLIAAILVHSFNNLYVLVMNIL